MLVAAVRSDPVLPFGHSAVRYPAVLDEDQLTIAPQYTFHLCKRRLGSVIEHNVQVMTTVSMLSGSTGMASQRIAPETRQLRPVQPSVCVPSSEVLATCRARTHDGPAWCGRADSNDGHRLSCHTPLLQERPSHGRESCRAVCESFPSEPRLPAQIGQGHQKSSEGADCRQGKRGIPRELDRKR